ncbi:MAG: type II toxin-antitoxin system Phd/YefM family antitoxin [Thermodesulfovibrionales bacterium]
MITVGIRELKAKLSSYIDKAKNGQQIVITDHGIEVAVINAVTIERRAIMSLVKEGDAHWSGGRPRGLDGIKIAGKAISETILEERQ